MAPDANLLVMQDCITYKKRMETLRSRRKALGLTLAQMAERVGVTEGQISRIERFGGASLATAVKLERETGLPAASFATPASADRTNDPDAHSQDAAA
jgi:transcriptional regulator with XRE-family HTH domain